MTVTTTSADVTAATTDNITTDSFNFSQTNATTQRSEDHENSNYILVIFGGFIIGALVRQVLGSARVPLPHTAILQALGVVAAWVATHWPVLMHVVDLRELELGALVHLFLPLLLFQPAFNAELHVLRVTFNQIVVLAFGAFLITAGVTLVLVLWVLNYDWPLRVVCVFCTVLAITDPSVQDFVTRCTGTSDETSGMLLGESLVTPIAAILVNKFVSFAVPEDVYTGSVLVGDLGYMLLTPLLAVLIAKVTAAWLQRIFNDAIMEITVVIVAVHLSSLVCNLFGVPGFLVNIALGLLLNANKTSVSPEVQTILYRFLLVLKDLIVSFTFLSVGILTFFRITEETNPLTVLAYSFALFVTICVGRTVALILLSPLLRRFGHFESLRHMFVVMCGGGRGALILTMGLDIATPHHYPLNKQHIANTIFIHVSVIVLLSQVIGFAALGSLLGFFSDDAQSARRKLEKRNILRILEKLRLSSISVLKLDKYIADADWEVVEKSTQLDSLGEDAKKRRCCCRAVTSVPDAGDGVVPLGLQDGQASSESTVSFERQRTKQRNSAIRKLLQAEKMAYWQMFTQGLLSKSAVQRLLVWADAARNQEGCYIDEKVEKKFAKVANHLRKLRDEVAKKIEKQKYPGSVEEAERRRSKYTRRLTSAVAYIFHACDAVLTTTALVVEFVPSMAALRKGLFIYNACYVGIFCMVVMGEIFVFRRKFFSDLWHVSGLVCMCLGLFDALILSTVDNMQQSDHAHSRSSLTGAEMEFLRVFVIITRYFRLYKVLEITPAALSLLLRLLDYRMGRRVIWGYDLARGYVMGEGEVMRQLGEVADGDSSLAADIRRHCTQSRLRVIRSMGLLQMRHPGVAGRVKTRYAACIVLNSKRDVIKEMGEEGLLEDTDIKLLLKNVELKMKKLANSAPRVPEVGLSDIVSNLPWVCGDSSLHDFIIQHGQVLTLDADQVLVEEGCPPGDIYVIISGVAKVEVGSRLQPEAGGEQDEAADYMTTGNVIGEYSLVTRSPMAHSVRAFTQLKVLFLNADTMRTAMSLTSEVEDNRRERNDENEELPSLEYRLWRAVATRIAYKVLLDEPAFMRVHKHGLRMRLADAYLVDGEERTEVIRDSTMSDLILVHGRAMDNLTREVYDGPCYLPFNVISLSLVSDSNARAILFIVPAGGDSPAPRHVLRSPASASGSLAFNNTHKKKMHEEPAPPLDRRHSVCAPSGPVRGTSSSNVLLPRRTRRSLHSKRNSSPAVLDEHFVGGWDSLGAAALATSPASPLSHRANHEPHATHVSEYSSFALRFPRTLWGSIGEEHSRHRLYLPRPSLTSLSIDSVDEEDGDSSSRQGDASSAYYSPALSPASLSPVLGSGTWNFFADNKGRVISGKREKDDDDDEEDDHDDNDDDDSDARDSDDNKVLAWKLASGGFINRQSPKEAQTTGKIILNSPSGVPLQGSASIASSSLSRLDDSSPQTAPRSQKRGIFHRLFKSRGRHTDPPSASKSSPNQVAEFSLAVLNEKVKKTRSLNKSRDLNLCESAHSSSPDSRPKTYHPQDTEAKTHLHPKQDECEVTYLNPCYLPSYGELTLSVVEQNSTGLDNPAFRETELTAEGPEKENE